MNTNQPPLNPDALEVAAKALYDHFKNQAANDGDSWPELEERDEVGHGIARDDAEVAVSAYLAAAQPVVNSVESLPAQMRMLMWEGGEFEVGEIPDGHVLVGFEMETDRAWSMADKVTVNIERPEVES